MEENRIRLDGGFHNDVFYIKDKGTVVRISDSKKTRDMVLQEVEWIDFLHKAGISVSKPETTLEYEEGRVRSYFEFIEGDHLDVTNAFHWNENVFEQWGKILGSMHALSKRFKVNRMHRPVWTVDQTDVFGIRGTLPPWIQEKYDGLMQSLCTYAITPETFGLIHNDFHQGNLMITKDGSIITIDFDDCAFNWYAQDIAVAFYHAYWQHSSFNDNIHTFPQTFMHHFFAGYQVENLLHEDIIKQIPIFLKLREIFLYQLFIRRWNLNDLEEWQKYTIQDLEEKIKQKRPYAGVSDFSIYT